MFDIVIFPLCNCCTSTDISKEKNALACNGYHRLDNNVRVERHDYPRTVCSVSQHYNIYIQRVGLEQKVPHHIKIHFVLAMIYLNICSFAVKQ